MSAYSRDNPSPRYTELLGYYKDMHEHGVVAQNIPASETFDGRSLPRHAGNIRKIARVTGSRTILDYGSGKGQQYGQKEVRLDDGTCFPDIRSFWNVDEIVCFDPGYDEFCKLPDRMFDGVISTDVLEHCPKEDIEWIVDEMFGYATKFVYVNVACYPATKMLPNGENAHCTLEDPSWWTDIFEARVRQSPGLRYFAAYDVPYKGPDGKLSYVLLFREGGADVPR